MARDFVFVGNGVHVANADIEREQPQRLEDEIPRPHPVEIFGEVAVKGEDVLIVSSLNPANEQLRLRIVEQREGDGECAKLAFEETERQMAFTGQPRRIIDNE